MSGAACDVRLPRGMGSRGLPLAHPAFDIFLADVPTVLWYSVSVASPPYWAASVPLLSRTRALTFRRRPEPSRQRFLQPLRCSVADPGDIAVGADQHRGGRSDVAKHGK